jgi:hypothetical protein
VTERTLPAVAFPVPSRSAGARTRRAVAVPVALRTDAQARTAVRRKDPLLTTSARAGMLIGASAAVYAVTLAGVAAFQSHDDRALVAQDQPVSDAVAQRRAANDRLQATLAALDGQLTTLGASYAATGQSVSGYEAQLTALASLVSPIAGSATTTPAKVSLPTVSTTRVTTSTSSSSSSSSSTASTSTAAAAPAAAAPAPTAKPAAAAPPPVTTTTTASGKHP